MTVNGIKIIGNSFAYDGCHKIYICEDEDDVNEALSHGYSILPISKLENAWVRSCPLRFIHNWKLTRNYVSQFEENVIFEKEVS